MPNYPTVTMTITREFTVEVEYDITPEERGSRDSLGVPMEPDYSASIEIISVKDENGAEFELTKQETKEAEEIIWEVEGDNGDE